MNFGMKFITHVVYKTNNIWLNNNKLIENWR